MPQRHTPGSLEDLGHPSTSQVALAQCGTLSGTRNVSRQLPSVMSNSPGRRNRTLMSEPAKESVHLFRLVRLKSIIKPAHSL